MNLLDDMPWLLIVIMAVLLFAQHESGIGLTVVIGFAWVVWYLSMIYNTLDELFVESELLDQQN